MTDMDTTVVVRKEEPWSPEAQTLLDEMDAAQALFYGASGRSHWFNEEVSAARGTFVVVRTTDGFALGCGALRRWNYSVAEITYLYSRVHEGGIERVLLSRLELDAAALGYAGVVIEADRANRRAIAFCERNGFRERSFTSGCVRPLPTVLFEKALLP
ncbi:acetyltransferase [Caballeronia grimmiae]|uniref:Acetyltransferase n=2 Tax=Caballeronia grimmiae TaxID=1071679 RepID=A0A069NAD2_9BURK|nr:acetyltransferase [Caballeronia grimmiae]GGD69783.1 N-acetyltransferase [Caballeronia grimmiae]